MLSTLFSPPQRLKTVKASGLVLGLAAALGLVAVPETFALSQLHPSFTVKRLLPAAMSSIPGIGGVDFLPNGDGVVCTWGGSQKSTGELWIVTGLASGEPGTATQIATGLREPLGVKVVGNDFYMLEKSRISKYSGSGTNFTRSNFFTLPTAWYNDQQWHHFSFGLAFRDSAFWFTTGTAYDYTPNDPIQRGALIRVPLSGSGFTQHARGLRNPAGLALGPEGEFFAPENEGHWKPINVLYHLPTRNMPANGRFYGFRTTGNNACGTTPSNIAGDNCPNDPEYPPAVWIPYGTDFSTTRFSNSPTEPILLKTGPYAGQMIGGDVYRGGMLRYYLEKVGDDYQGAVFDFMTGGSQGINFGIYKMLHTTTGSILVAGIGGGASTAGCALGGSGNWNYNGACRGLDLLTPTTTAPFEMLAVRSTPDGFDIEFTKPAGTMAGTATNYTVRTAVHTAVQTYGADASTTDNNVTVGVTSATLSADGKRVSLKLASLLTKRMYTITLNTAIRAAEGNEALYTNVAYYTLNKVNNAVSVADKARVHAKTLAFEMGKGIWRLDAQEAFDLALLRPDGKMVKRLAGKHEQTFSLQGMEKGVYLLSGQVGGKSYQQRLVVQ